MRSIDDVIAESLKPGVVTHVKERVVIHGRIIIETASGEPSNRLPGTEKEVRVVRRSILAVVLVLAAALGACTSPSSGGSGGGASGAPAESPAAKPGY